VQAVLVAASIKDLAVADHSFQLNKATAAAVVVLLQDRTAIPADAVAVAVAETEHQMAALDHKAATAAAAKTVEYFAVVVVVVLLLMAAVQVQATTAETDLHHRSLELQ
jgi:hypothetical protein